MTAPDVAVVGGGVIGLGVAWRCAQRGLRVTVVAPEGPAAASGAAALPGSAPEAEAVVPGGASAVAAGMLAPVTEAHFGELPLLRLALESARRWPEFAAELAAASDTDLGYRTDGTLLVAYTDDDLREVERLHRFYRSLGLPAEAVTGRECRARMPLLAPRIRGGMYAAGDHQVDPRRLTAALRRAATRAGVTFDRRRVDDLAELEAGQIVLAAGAESARLADLPVRPVKGQILRLRTGAAAGFALTVRALSTSRSVYLVPRADGEVVVGATVEERGDRTVTAGGVQELLRAAIDVVPEVSEYQLVETAAGLRPGTPDNAPLLGRLDDRVVAATGHYRQGILLAPVTADTILTVVIGGTPDEIAPFHPHRFAPGASPATTQPAAAERAVREVAR
ncbi:MAG: glycine oxidase ThiO [Micromonosporaceae bacterium]